MGTAYGGAEGPEPAAPRYFCPCHGASHQEAEGNHGAEGPVLTPFTFCRVGSEPKRGCCPAGGCQHPQHHSGDLVASSDSEKVVSQMFTHTSSGSCEGLIPGHYKQRWPRRSPGISRGAQPPCQVGLELQLDPCSTQRPALLQKRGRHSSTESRPGVSCFCCPAGKVPTFQGLG